MKSQKLFALPLTALVVLLSLGIGFEYTIQSNAGVEAAPNATPSTRICTTTKATTTTTTQSVKTSSNKNAFSNLYSEASPAAYISSKDSTSACNKVSTVSNTVTITSTYCLTASQEFYASQTGSSTNPASYPSSQDQDHTSCISTKTLTKTTTTTSVFTITYTGATTTSTVYKPTVTTSTSITASSTLFTPFAMYYTATDSTDFFRSPTPVAETTNNGKDILLEWVTPSSTKLLIADSSGAYHDLGFYYSLGGLTLGNLVQLAHGLTVEGNGPFSVRVWFSPNSFSWSPSNALQSFGSGNYGTGPTNQGSGVTLSGTTKLLMAEAPCAGAVYSLSQLAEGSCGLSPNSYIAIWIGISVPASAHDSFPGFAFASVSSMYIS